jgi:hypothetical protein
MERLNGHPDDRIYVSDYYGVEQDKLKGLVKKIISNCSFFEGLSTIPTATVADQSRALAFALNASMTEESREWWLSVDERNSNSGLGGLSYWMMQIILSSYRPNLLRGKPTGYKQWYYPGGYKALWSIQVWRETRDGSWFNATKKILAEILESESENSKGAATVLPLNDHDSLVGEIMIRMLHEEGMREELRTM